MQSDQVMVACRNVGQTFYSEGRENRVLQGLSFEITKGEFVVLIGPSGCGKSTLLNLIAGFAKSSTGTILVNGAEVQKPGPDKAVVFQDYALLPWLNARENVEIGLRIQGLHPPERRRMAMEFLNLVGLSSVAERPAYKLSGGIQQRVSIARALALRPNVLLMDEPFGALDAFQRGAMHRELIRIWEITKATIVFVTHSLEEALTLGQRVIAMSPGAAGITGDIEVNLARPRDPMSAEFTVLKRKLYQMLTAGMPGSADSFLE